jgi:hypothetical protein
VDDTNEEEVNHILHPPIDTILARRPPLNNPAAMETEVIEYFVKYKDRSYHHLKWVPEEEIVADKRNGRLKIGRFMRDQASKIPESEDED